MHVLILIDPGEENKFVDRSKFSKHRETTLNTDGTEEAGKFFVRRASINSRGKQLLPRDKR